MTTSRTTSASRPIPLGRVTPEEAFTFGMVLSVGSVLTLGVLVNWVAGALRALQQRRPGGREWVAIARSPPVAARRRGGAGRSAVAGRSHAPRIRLPRSAELGAPARDG